MSRLSFPFLQISDGHVHPQVWMCALGNEDPLPVGAAVENWDYTADLTFHREMKVEALAALEDVRVEPSTAQFELVVTLVTGEREGFRTIVWREPIPPEDTALLKPKFVLDASQLSSKLTLKTEIVLSKLGEPLSVLAPSRAGSRLWAESFVAQLEGGLGRFPIEVCDFASVFPRQTAALWILSWDPLLLDSTFTGSVRLYLNSSQEEFVRRITDEDPLTLSLIMGTVIEQMVTCVLGDVSFVERFPDFEENTVGAVISFWLSQSFPGMPAEALVAAYQGDPGGFSATLSSLGVLRNE